MDMVERVARALYGDIEFETAFETAAEAQAQNEADERAGHFDYGEHGAREAMLAKARAAIEAMRLPTQAMEYAGGIKCEGLMFGGDAEYTGVIFTDMGVVFRTMVDAALTHTHSGEPG